MVREKGANARIARVKQNMGQIVRKGRAKVKANVSRKRRKEAAKTASLNAFSRLLFLLLFLSSEEASEETGFLLRALLGF